jgi:uncharacterized damage-inducible protein DinB
MSKDLVQQYLDGAEKVSQAIRGLTREDLLCKPGSDAGVGLWSIQQVVIHLVDCEGVHVDRMKRVIAEENSTLMTFDENKWAANLAYEDRNADDEAKLFAASRRQMASILKNLPSSAFSRFGNHNEAGRKTLEDLVKTSIHHLDHHLKFIHAKRAKMGKEMW